jgi:hypothetical protein
MKKRIIFKLRSVLGRSAFGFSVIRLCTRDPRRKKLLVSSNSNICIEGYPRCANTFAVLAFESAQERSLDIAHHMHLAGQVIYSANKGIPTIVLLRNPLDACVSMLFREPELDPRLCLRMYIDFHKPLLRYLDQIVVAPFDRVTSEYALIIRRVNEFYSTDFGVYENSREKDKGIFKKMSGLPLEESKLSVARPTVEKQEKKDTILAALITKANETLLKECNELYSVFLKYC